MAVKPVQSAPNFNAGIANPMLAHFHYAQAKQAQVANQWQQVCVHAQACAVAARQDVKLRILAKELLAEGLSRTHQIEQALITLVELNQLKPNDSVVLSNIGLSLTSLHRYEEAISYLQQAVNLQPNYAIAHVNLGLALSKHGEDEQAKACYLHAIRIDPQFMQPKHNLGRLLMDEGLVDEAQQVFEEVLQYEPNHLKVQGNVIFMQYSRYPLDLQLIKEMTQRFARVIEGGVVLAARPKPSQLQRHTPLIVGFVSGDLREHPVGFFLESTLAQINANSELSRQLTLVAYSNRSSQDEYQRRLHAQFDVWRDIEDWNDDQFVGQIYKDQIDILIDLSGNTDYHRLTAFAKKPAPLQISWLGYFGSTGLTSIDYVLADSVSVPEGEERWFVEKIWRLPHLRYCFSIPNDAPDVSPLPSLTQTKMVMGCYQVSSKMNDGVLRCWSDVLKACPNVRLRIQSIDFVRARLKDLFVERLVKANIDIQRVDLIGKMTRKDYLSSYAEVDILLDTFPYPGGTTTAEALWMGVPTLTLALPSMLGRQGEALMMNAGLSDWIARCEEEYVQKAIAWGNADVPKRQELAELRMTLREQVRQSPVFEAKQFASDFVDALYGMWNEKYGS
ncbi:MAG: tetratricopeptide repeat protein [Gammaproteobacteria bacterium]|nr:tetratricopeptide repeat protein [Gammaproteobacteria bacterium]